MQFTYFLAFNPLVSKYTYRLQSRMAADVVFLNWGYEEDPPMALPLAESDEPYRFPIQLYHRTATQADLSGKRVLEVGCGHGGGASYLMRTLRPASYTGLDLNRGAVACCRERHNLLGVDFVHGDAEQLPFPDQSFDAVINIESSGAYPHFSRFLAEVARVLRPEGRFLYADSAPPRQRCRVGGGAGRCTDADAFAGGRQCAGSARDGEEYAAVTGAGGPLAVITAAHCPRIRWRRRLRVLPRDATREVSVPDVLLYERLRTVKPGDRW